ncbi:MAG: hypothetical protein ACRDRL_24290 [Sciscionella sp.]
MSTTEAGEAIAARRRQASAPRGEQRRAGRGRRRAAAGGSARPSMLSRFSGVVAVLMVLLALLALGAYALVRLRSIPGPPLGGVLVQLGVAAVVVPTQRIADRRRGAPSTMAALAVIVLTAAMVWTFWLA